MKASPAGVFPQIEVKAAATLDERKAAALFTRLARNRTWITPTLVFFVAATIEERALADDVRLKYIPEATRERWRNQWRQRPAGFPERQALLNKSRLQIVRLMHRTGVGLLAGTDMLNPFLFPGFSLHDELEVLVQAGLSPLEALRTATVNPARFLGREKEFGTVERGKLADLVLLAANPLQDIRHTQRIAAVIIGGRLHDRSSLDAMLALAAGKPDAAAVRPLFDLRSTERGPFPSDRFTAADANQNTGRRVNMPMPPDCTTNASECEDRAVLNQLDGFNMQARISVPFDGAIDPASVTGRTIFLLKLGDALARSRDFDAGDIRTTATSPVGINQIVWDPAVGAELPSGCLAGSAHDVHPCRDDWCA